MSEISFVRESLQSLHSAFGGAVKGLSQDEAHFRPNNKANHIAFIAWHYTRTVDNIVRFVLQRQPTVWMAGKWDQKFGLDSKTQGTGMSPGDAAALRISDIQAFYSYMNEVWQEAKIYLDTVSEQDLDRKMTIKPLGELTLREVLGNTLLTHGYTHLGEIWLLKGLQGLRGSPF